MTRLWRKFFPDALPPEGLTTHQLGWPAVYILRPAGDRKRWSVTTLSTRKLIHTHLAKHPELKGKAGWWQRGNACSQSTQTYEGDTDAYIDAVLQYERLMRKERKRREALRTESKKNTSSWHWDEERQQRHNKRKWKESVRETSRSIDPSRSRDEPTQRYEPEHDELLELELSFKERVPHRNGHGANWIPTRKRYWRPCNNNWKQFGRRAKQWVHE